MCAMTHSYICHDSFQCDSHHTHVWCSRIPPFCLCRVCHDSFMCVPWLIHKCAMTHSYVCHNSFISAPWLIHMFATTHSDVSRHPHVLQSKSPPLLVSCLPWRIHICAMTHSYVCHDSFICVPWLIHLFAITHSNVTRHSRVMQSNPHPLFLWGGYG